MRRKKTVLLTSAGVATAINVISALRRSTFYEFHIIAVDMDCHAAGLHLADRSYLVPPIHDPSYLDKMLSLVSRHDIDFIFPLYSREISIFAGARARLEEAGARLFIPDPKLVALCDDKPRFMSFLAEHGFGFPHTYGSFEEIREFPIFIKPTAGSSSANTFKVVDSDELAFYLKKYPNSIIQEFVGEREYTVDCLVDEAHRIVASVSRERLRVKDGKSVVARTVKDKAIIKEVHCLLEALKLTGPCNVQLFFDGESVRFVEVNPRLAAGGLPLAVESGVNIPELMVRLGDGELCDYQDFEDDVVMIRYLSELFTRNESIAEI